MLTGVPQYVGEVGPLMRASEPLAGDETRADAAAATRRRVRASRAAHADRSRRRRSRRACSRDAGLRVDRLPRPAGTLERSSTMAMGRGDALAEEALAPARRAMLLERAGRTARPPGPTCPSSFSPARVTCRVPCRARRGARGARQLTLLERPVRVATLVTVLRSGVARAAATVRRPQPSRRARRSSTHARAAQAEEANQRRATSSP